MASYHVFVSFHKEDIHQTNLSYLRNRFSYNGITMFDSIGHAFTQAIRESRISLVVLTENYVSSYRCLNELVEIFKCKKEMRQIVIPILYGVDPSDVKTQTGDFRNVFDKTCAGKTKEEKRRWSQAFTDVVGISGLVLTRIRDGWNIDAEKIEKFVIEVLSRHENEQSPSNVKQLVKRKIRKTEEDLQEVTLILEPELSSSNKRKRRRKRKSQFYAGLALLVLINLLLEVASTVVDQLFSIHKPYFGRISLVMSILSVVLSILDLSCKVQGHKARFLCKWPIPWFYYPPRRYNIIFGSFTDIVLWFCAVGHLIVSTVNCSFTERGQEGPIKVSVWPLFFAIGMLISKFMEEPANSEDILPTTTKINDLHKL